MNYILLYPQLEAEDLVNPLQALAQLCGFYFYFASPNKNKKMKLLIQLCFFLIVFSTLFIKKRNLTFLAIFCISYLLSIQILPLNIGYFFIFWGYMFTPELGKWGFFMTFQLVAFYALNFIFERKKVNCFFGIKQFLAFIILLLIQYLVGLGCYNINYFLETERLLCLVSGASIIYISFTKRTPLAFGGAFALYLLCSIIIGIMVSPTSKITNIWGIPGGLFIFLTFHLLLLVGFLLLNIFIPPKWEPLIPLYFSKPPLSLFNIGPGHTSVRPGRADRFLAPKSEGERDLVSPGMIAAGCRRPDGLWEGKVKLAETPA